MNMPAFVANLNMVIEFVEKMERDPVSTERRIEHFREASDKLQILSLATSEGQKEARFTLLVMAAHALDMAQYLFLSEAVPPMKDETPEKLGSRIATPEEMAALDDTNYPTMDGQPNQGDRT